MDSTLKLYASGFAQGRTYLIAAFLVMGNIILPQICHLLPQGGIIWLPIYFFTLLGAYKFGWQIGILTALASPLVNYAIFGMPSMEMVPVIMLKSSLLAIIAACVAHRTGKATILALVVVVMGYQVIGTLGEWAIVGSFATAIQDFRIGLPGILMQIVAGYLVLNFMMKD